MRLADVDLACMVRRGHGTGGAGVAVRVPADWEEKANKQLGT